MSLALAQFAQRLNWKRAIIVAAVLLMLAKVVLTVVSGQEIIPSSGTTDSVLYTARDGISGSYSMIEQSVTGYFALGRLLRATMVILVAILILLLAAFSFNAANGIILFQAHIRYF